MKKKKNIFMRNQRKKLFKLKGFKQALSLVMVLLMCLVLLPQIPTEAAGETFNPNYIYLNVSGMNKNSSYDWTSSPKTNLKMHVKNWGALQNATGTETINGVEYVYWDASQWTNTDHNFEIIYKDLNTAKANGYARASLGSVTVTEAKGKSFCLDETASETKIDNQLVYVLKETGTGTTDDDIFFAKATFYDYYGKNIVGNTATGAVDSEHYFFENFNEKISNYAKENGILYPLYFGDFNLANNKSDYPEHKPEVGQPLSKNAYNFYWNINRASRTDNNSTNGSTGNKYTASVQGLVSENLKDGNLMQKTKKPIIEETICDFSKIQVVKNDSATSAEKTTFDGKDVIKFNGNKKSDDTAFNAKVTASEAGYNFGASSKSKYLYFDVYTDSNETGSPYIAIKDNNSTLHQVSAWIDGVAGNGYDNKISKGQWKTMCIDLSKLNNANNVDLSNIDSIYFGFWNNDTIYISNIKFVSENGYIDSEVEMPCFNSSFLSSNAIGETTSEMQFPFKKRTKYVDNKPCDYYIFTSGKTGYKSDASNQEKATTDVVRINRETNSLDYWFDVPSNSNNIVRDMNGTSGWGTGKNSAGFFPFNTSKDSGKVPTTSSGDGLNYGFGSKITIPFTLTEDGQVYCQDGKTKVPMQFNFKGDDDVWVYIDGKLVLDMGGGHTQTTGNINFATNKATVDNVVDAKLTSNSLHEPVVTKVTDFSLGEDEEKAENKYDTEKVHTMTVYYMERGMIESNLYIDFNFVPEQNDLIVEKEVNTDGVNETLKNQVDKIAKEDTNFNFNLSNKKQSEINTEIQDTFTYENDSNNKYVVYNDLEDKSKVGSSNSVSIVKSSDKAGLINDTNHKAVLEINQSNESPNENFKTEVDSILTDSNGTKDLSSVNKYLIFDVYNDSNDGAAGTTSLYPFVALRDSNGKQIAGWCTTSYTYNGENSYINKDNKGKWVTVCVDLSKLKNNKGNGANDPTNFDFSKVKNIWIGYWAKGSIYLDNIIFSSKPEMPSNITTKIESITNSNFNTVSNLKYNEKDAEGNITKDKEMNETNFGLKDNYTATFYDKFEKNSQVIGKEIEDSRFNTTWVTKDLSGGNDVVLGSGEGVITDPFTISTDNDEASHMTHYIKFTNSIKTSDLEIQKELSDGSTPEDTFRFKVKFKNIFGSTTDEINYSGKYIVNGEEKQTTQLEDGSYVLEFKAGETATITGIPVGTEYEIEEVSKDGYEVQSIKVDSTFKTINETEETITNGIKVTTVETNTSESKLINSEGTTTTKEIITKTTTKTTTLVNGKKNTVTEGPIEKTEKPEPATSTETVTNGIYGTIQNGTVSTKVTYKNIANKGSIKIVKADSETQETITAFVAEFKIQKLKDESKDKEVNEITNDDFDTSFTEITDSTDKGVLKFDNLPMGTYLITEVEAPSGYIKLDKSFKITIPYKYKAGDTVDGKVAVTDGEKLDVTLKVLNTKAVKLPNAGLKGIRLYLAIGTVFVIISGAFVLYKLNKNKKVN